MEGGIALEYAAECLNGVDFHKGCYVGQELVARTHFKVGGPPSRVLASPPLSLSLLALVSREPPPVPAAAVTTGPAAQARHARPPPPRRHALRRRPSLRGRRAGRRGRAGRRRALGAPRRHGGRGAGGGSSGAHHRRAPHGQAARDSTRCEQRSFPSLALLSGPTLTHADPRWADALAPPAQAPTSGWRCCG